MRVGRNCQGYNFILVLGDAPFRGPSPCMFSSLQQHFFKQTPPFRRFSDELRQPLLPLPLTSSLGPGPSGLLPLHRELQPLLAAPPSPLRLPPLIPATTPRGIPPHPHVHRSYDGRPHPHAHYAAQPFPIARGGKAHGHPEQSPHKYGSLAASTLRSRSPSAAAAVTGGLLEIEVKSNTNVVASYSPRHTGDHYYYLKRWHQAFKMHFFVFADKFISSSIYSITNAIRTGAYLGPLGQTTRGWLSYRGGFRYVEHSMEGYTAVKSTARKPLTRLPRDTRTDCHGTLTPSVKMAEIQFGCGAAVGSTVLQQSDRLFAGSRLTESHTGKYLAELSFECLERFGIGHLVRYTFDLRERLLFVSHHKTGKAPKVGRGTKRKRVQAGAPAPPPPVIVEEELALDEDDGLAPEERELAQTLVDIENEAPINTGEQAHDEAVIRSVRDRAIAAMNRRSVKITDEQNRTALGPDLDAVIHGWMWMDVTCVDVDGLDIFDFLRTTRGSAHKIDPEYRLVT
ncbi:hypothetical protein B0H13DRAFT_1864434 [Mycena leptocephala]|nr:hypothetical protein B0H13DRAFT_1864434 [Mycena leptocephala]